MGTFILATAISCTADKAKKGERLASPEATTAPSRSAVNPPPPALVLNNAQFSTVLKLYAELTRRTVLSPLQLPNATFSLQISPENGSAAAKEIEKALRAQAIATVNDGDKFVMVIPAAQLSSTHPHSPQPTAAAPAELIPAGTINFMGLNSAAVARIYSELMGRKFDAATSARLEGTIILRTQTPLSKAECLYALDTLFEWQGIKMVPVGLDLIRAVPIPAK